jgi:hypothetical protein
MSQSTCYIFICMKHSVVQYSIVSTAACVGEGHIFISEGMVYHAH